MHSSAISPPAAAARSLTLTVAKDVIPCFRPLLEQGFTIKVAVGQSIAQVLCLQLGMAEEYLRNRVQTVFLNGRAVDDENKAVVRDGDRLALSASMPGLAGATMRKSGFFSGLRAGISHRKSADAATGGAAGIITIKLFNMIAAEIGPLFLSRGIGIRAGQFEAFRAGVGDGFWRQVQNVDLDGRACDVQALASRNWSGGNVLLNLHTN